MLFAIHKGLFPLSIITFGEYCRNLREITLSLFRNVEKKNVALGAKIHGQHSIEIKRQPSQALAPSFRNTVRQ